MLAWESKLSSCRKTRDYSAFKLFLCKSSRMLPTYKSKTLATWAALLGGQ